jgi:hypothetical protein
MTWQQHLCLLVMPLYYVVESIVVLALCGWRCYEAVMDIVRCLADSPGLLEKCAELEKQQSETRQYLEENNRRDELWDLVGWLKLLHRCWITLVLWLVLIKFWLSWWTAPLVCCVDACIGLFVLLLVPRTLEERLWHDACHYQQTVIQSHRQQQLHQAYVAVQWQKLQDHLVEARKAHAVRHPLPLEEPLFIENYVRALEEYGYRVSSRAEGPKQLLYNHSSLVV